MNCQRYKVFWLICDPNGSLKYSSWVVLRTTLGKLFYMQIRSAITEKSILLNISATMHDNVTEMVFIPMFSWSRIKIKALKKLPHPYILSLCKLVAAITEKSTLLNISATLHDNVTEMVSISMFSWSKIKIKALKMLPYPYTSSCTPCWRIMTFITTTK